MNSLEDKLKYLKGLSKIIVSLESDITNTLSQNQNLSKLKSNLEENIRELNQENEELIAIKNTLTNTLCEKEEEIFALKNKSLEQNNFANNNGAISLGINNLSVRNREAIHDALSYFDKKCPYCNEDLFVTTSRKQFEVDHFYPVVKGGQNVPWNLLPVCQSCNRKKKDIHPHIFLNTNSFKEVSNYLKSVHQKFRDEAIDSYTFKEKLGDLIKKEYNFVKRNINSDFITTLLYLAEEHNIIQEEIAYAAQKGYSETDEKAVLIVEYLDKEIPDDWGDFNLLKRRKFLKGKESIENKSRNLYQRKFVCTAEIWCEGLGKEKKDLDRYTSREINNIMKSLVDWKQSKSTKRFDIYGVQKFYKRIN